MRVPDDVRAFLDRVTPATRKRDAEVLLHLMGDITGERPALHGTIVGFGTYHYKYASGRGGDADAAAFAPRKGAMVVYLMDGIASHRPISSGSDPTRPAWGASISRISTTWTSASSNASFAVPTPR